MHTTHPRSSSRPPSPSPPAAMASLFYDDLDFLGRSYDGAMPRLHEPEPPRRAYYDEAPRSLPKPRKNSIEMFLSQSPSQHLGNDFLRMTLDEPPQFYLNPELATFGPPSSAETTTTTSTTDAWYQQRSYAPEPAPMYTASYAPTSAPSMRSQQQWSSRPSPPLPSYPSSFRTSAPRSAPRSFPLGNRTSGLFDSLKSPLKPCKFYAQGHCRMGTKCKFAHQLPTAPSSTASSAASFEDEYASYPSFRPTGHQPSSLDPSSLPELSPNVALTVDDLLGRVYAMSKDQNGCRLLQEQLDGRSDLCDVIYTEAVPHLVDMMVDPFGNYLFQKLLERVTDAQRLVIVQHVAAHLVAAALNLHGTRSVQKVVEVCATDRALASLIVSALEDDAVRLCIDSNGNHVIQRALQFLPAEFNQFVFDAVAADCTVVGTHRHGCCVLQRCVDAANERQKRAVIAQVERHAMKLMQDPYGNYVVQYVLDACPSDETVGVMAKCVGHLFELSVQKFSSNVVEKCLELAPYELRQTFVKELIASPRMQRMLQDQFANYVVQRALSVASDEHCLCLVHAIAPHLPSMKNTSGGRRIQARILKRFPHMVEMAMLGEALPLETPPPLYGRVA
ncbi:hypothetical protein SPRG_15362 [Saprolegnia parasitica CBS 223.65]|uniref:C3H1-type domain-containing protein n=2 Tax=Saprolegnia parasitica TaxID=101203 RepID=A0A067BXZ3_SAPPC|nr:hypothetical protein SPRG_15362 [Saprolegnia parasitica CBS 223.65]KDO19457.1 hypothetical protein SPRG_15362 [Saprolegnia parasitica CBS 223.65]|eukprot:XP_012209840.1 hypothetical protein SPRG_15362 [Saprolegnia parasitica CBS 223.65]